MKRKSGYSSFIVIAVIVIGLFLLFDDTIEGEESSDEQSETVQLREEISTLRNTIDQLEQDIKALEALLEVEHGRLEVGEFLYNVGSKDQIYELELTPREHEDGTYYQIEF
ncbi:hypothetical protein QA612_00760 [Evansella sp. AB-P1]|uniref:hypothetical protein n=1 Tax=Evansella sp. AB-P1 TaxID=3037653 RepID=UPI00241DE472|nr:hypothetical protein [Evansella sp. AB-P1]MDG5786000.1 hypothetical protein [Evansella sp. AB-P1]